MRQRDEDALILDTLTEIYVAVSDTKNDASRPVLMRMMQPLESRLKRHREESILAAERAVGVGMARIMELARKGLEAEKQGRAT